MAILSLPLEETRRGTVTGEVSGSEAIRTLLFFPVDVPEAGIPAGKGAGEL